MGIKTTKIKDEIENIEYDIPTEILNKNFKLPYALTCDSVQGLSFEEDEKITIFDTNTPYTDKKYIWTAITRARKLENINIFIHSDFEINNLCQSKIKQYFNFKINNYKNQDKKAKREIDDKNYITEQWIAENLEKCEFKCLYCKKYLNIEIDYDTVKTDITVDRIHNNLAHTKNNCVISCLNCNLRKGNRY